MNAQGEFAFDEGEKPGSTRWLGFTRIASKEMAHRLQLPLNRKVEVWLYGGIRLRGKLLLKEDLLFIPEDSVRHLELKVDGVSFTYREVESCVALD